MTETIFDHDRLDVYRLAVEYAAESLLAAKGLSGLHRHVRDQWLLTRMAMKLDGVAEATADYRADSDYEHEHRFAEHEHETAREPEPSVGPEPRSGLAEWMR